MELGFHEGRGRGEKGGGGGGGELVLLAKPGLAGPRNPTWRFMGTYKSGDKRPINGDSHSYLEVHGCLAVG